MKLVIANSIKKTEFEPGKNIFSLEIVKAAAKKSLCGLGDNIKNPVKISGAVLSKIYLTGVSGAGRAVFLLKVGAGVSILVMVRAKKDKQIGSNMTVNNLKFRNLLEKNLSSILKDMESGSYIAYPIY